MYISFLIIKRPFGSMEKCENRKDNKNSIPMGFNAGMLHVQSKQVQIL